MTYIKIILAALILLLINQSVIAEQTNYHRTASQMLRDKAFQSQWQTLTEKIRKERQAEYARNEDGEPVEPFLFREIGSEATESVVDPKFKANYLMLRDLIRAAFMQMEWTKVAKLGDKYEKQLAEYVSPLDADVIITRALIEAAQIELDGQLLPRATGDKAAFATEFIFASGIGLGHPNVADYYLARYTVALKMGDHEEAYKYLLEVQWRYMFHFDPQHPKIIDLWAHTLRLEEKSKG